MNYDKWVKKIFCHEENVDIAPIRDDVEIDDIPTLSERDTLKMVTRLFESSEETLKVFSNEQVVAGLKYLTNEAEDSLRGIYSIDIPVEERLMAVQSIYFLFCDCLVQRCDNCLIDDCESKNPLNMFCYMFWDASQISLYGFQASTNDDYREKLMDAVIEVLKKTLHLSHLACQEAALHGLGHFLSLEKKLKMIDKKILLIIDDYLKTGIADNQLYKYAKQARSGMIL